MSHHDDEVRGRLSMFFHGEQNRIDAYLAKYGYELSMSHINEVRQLDLVALQALLPPPETGEDPTYIIEVECPVCHQGHIKCIELKAKSLKIIHNQFGAPIYQGGNGYRNYNYNLNAVTVCPKCLFASPDHKDFRVFSPFSKQWTGSQISALTLMELVKTMGERLTLIEGEPFASGLQENPRSLGAAILSYRIAMERSEVEIRNGVPLAHFKKGFYWIKIALLQSQKGEDDSPALEMALQELVEAFKRSDIQAPAQEFQLLYTISALYLRMGQTKECRQYMTLLDQIKNDFATGKRRDKENLPQLSQWLDKSQQLWDERESSDLWQIPTK